MEELETGDEHLGENSSTETSDSSISRRKFLAGAAGAGALLGVGALVGCSPTKPDDTEASSPAENATNEPIVPDETLSTDILIVGAGMSGLACAVQAGLEGVPTLVLEKGSTVGGGGIGVEGLFAVGSKLQNEAGIEIEPFEIVQTELEEGQFRADGNQWIDLINKSSDNIDWLSEQGVEFSGQVDNYHTGLYETMHWFKDGRANVGYVDQMWSRAEDLGVEFKFNTGAFSLIIDNGKVVGAYAKDDSNLTVQIDAKAVIIATGGSGSNVELLKKTSWGSKAENLLIGGVPTVTGDGYLMATEVGGKDFLAESCDLAMPSVLAFSDAGPGAGGAEMANAPYNALTMEGPAGGGPFLWVNQDAFRFTNENIAGTMKNMMLTTIPPRAQRTTYSIFDQKRADYYLDIGGLTAETFERGLTENAYNSFFSAESIEGLAKAVDLDSKTLAATINRYNELCAASHDADFGKDPELMVAIDTPPFYIARLDYSLLVAIGAITTNIRREVLNDDLYPIPGLYATGNDGVMLYRNVYTINMPGTACGNCVNTGRDAAMNAAEYIATA